jgi:hypothetical protein
MSGRLGSSQLFRVVPARGRARPPTRNQREVGGTVFELTASFLRSIPENEDRCGADRTLDQAEAPQE